MIEHIRSILSGSVIFLIGLITGILINLVGLTPFFSTEIFGIPLIAPIIGSFILVGFFIILLFKKDKIEQIKSQ